MKVRMLRNPAAALCCDLTEGQTGTVDTVLGETLVKAGIAVEIPEPKAAAEPKPKIETVPAKPAIAEAKPATIQPSAKEAPKAETPKPTTSPQKSGGTNPTKKDK